MLEYEDDAVLERVSCSSEIGSRYSQLPMDRLARMYSPDTTIIFSTMPRLLERYSGTLLDGNQSAGIICSVDSTRFSTARFSTTSGYCSPPSVAHRSKSHTVPHRHTFTTCSEVAVSDAGTRRFSRCIYSCWRKCEVAG